MRLVRMLFRCFWTRCLWRRSSTGDSGMLFLQPRARKRDDVRWIGALLLSFVVLPFGTGVVFEQAKLLQGGGRIDVFSLFVVSTVLMLCCDVALVSECVVAKRNEWVRGSLDSLVWIAAVARKNGRTNKRKQPPFSRSCKLALTVLCLDVALTVHAVKTRRTE